MSLLDDQKTALASTPRGPTMRVRAFRLEVVAGPDAGREARVDRPCFLVGTGPTADLRLSDDTVSREHLRLSLGEEGLRVRDDGSTNGTWVGDQRIFDVLIGSDTRLSVGDTVLDVRIDAEATELPVAELGRFGEAIGESPAMRHVFAILTRAAATEATILIEGESGVGKEVLAQAVHGRSNRAEGPFVTVDCGAIPANLIESELFGHVRGAFTGADKARIGAFEQACGGTLFLDEIGELPLELQPRLLRVLEARTIQPVGGRPRPIDVRILAATNRNLAEAAARDEFRRDLFYRLAVVRVNVPPLRDRTEDIMPLARAFLARSGSSRDFPPDVGLMLRTYGWPGNVREVRNVVDRFNVLGSNPAALFDTTPGGRHAATSSADANVDATLDYHEARRIAMDRFERAYLPAVLARAGNVITHAAQLAGVGRGSFHRMLHRIQASSGGDDDATQDG